MWCCARRSPVATPTARRGPTRTRWPSSSCTVSCTCWGWTTPTPRKRRPCSAASASCSVVSTNSDQRAVNTTDWIYLVAIVFLIAFTGFLAMSETALTRMNRVKALALEEEGKRRAATLVRLVEHPERWLNPVLLVLLTCHLVTATLVG